MKTLDISVERTGFPVKLDGEEFFFDCSTEHITAYETDYQELMKKLESEATQEEPDLDQVRNMLGEAYDLLLGHGAFDRLYPKIPDTIAWSNALIDLSEGIYQNVQSFKKEQEQKSKDVKEKYLLKKSKKNKR